MIARLLAALLVLAPVSAASAQTVIVNFDTLADNASANLDPVAAAKGIRFLSGFNTEDLDEYGDPIPGDWHWEAYDDSDIRVADPEAYGRGPAPSGDRTVNALWDQLLIRFDTPRALKSFGFSEDPSSYGDLFATEIWFLDASGKTLFTAGPFTPNSNRTHRYDFTFAPAAVSQILLPSTSKLYDNLTFGFVPEPATWAMLIIGFGLVGAAARRRPLIA